MCLIAFAYKEHPEYDLIFAANRDEFYDRPTRAAQFWEKYSHILAGKDLQAGGTWMGITRKGYFSALTNFRDPSVQKENPPSRGHLVLDYLIRENDPEQYLKNVKQQADEYNGFNLLTGTPQKLMYFSSRQNELHTLDPGLYGLSNHLLNTPWPKVERAKNDLRRIISDDSISEDAIFELLENDEKAPDENLPDTGIPKELEKAVSPIFIKTDKYGTRCATVLLIKKDGQVTFTEKRFKAAKKEVEGSNHYEFNIKK